MIIGVLWGGVLVVWIADWAWLALLLRLPRTSRKTFSTANRWRRTLRLGGFMIDDQNLSPSLVP